MKRTIWILLFTFVMAANLWADDLDQLQGKWSVKKTREGGSFTQQLEFKKNKWTFRLLGSDGLLVLVASGDVEMKKQGAFSSARFFNIKAGRTESEMEAVDDERNSVYMLDAGTLYLASNFDRARDNEKPTVDAYTKSN